MNSDYIRLGATRWGLVLVFGECKGRATGRLGLQVCVCMCIFLLMNVLTGVYALNKLYKSDDPFNTLVRYMGDSRLWV